MDLVNGMRLSKVLLLLLMQVIGASSLLCYLCQDLPDSEQCFNVVKCTASEVCYGKTERLASGNITHTTGCRDLQLQPMQEQGRVTVCNEHCQEDFCNLRSCVSNATLTRVPPRCPSCDYVHQPEDCKHVTQCKQNEQCFVHKFNAFGLTRYRMGCVSQEHCAATSHAQAGPAIIGKRSKTRRSDDCLLCCSQDHCNAFACHNTSSNLGVSALRPIINSGNSCNDSVECSTFALLDENACRQRHVVDICPTACETCGFFGWQPWQAWNSCDTSCGGGTKTRQRSCQSQINVGSVTHCVGDATDTATCNSGSCQGNGSSTVVQTTTTGVTPGAPCTSKWSQWINKDTPYTGKGDIESWTTEQKAAFCPTGGSITDIECKTTTNISYYKTGDVMACTIENGSVCFHDDNYPIPCIDYQIRYQCTTCTDSQTTPLVSGRQTAAATSTVTTTVTTSPTPFESTGVSMSVQTPGLTLGIQCTSRWSAWINSDTPYTGIGDKESWSVAQQKTFCPHGRITSIECMATDGIMSYNTGEITRCTLAGGFVCKHEDNFPLPCSDYMVRYQCTCDATTRSGP